MRLQQKSHLLSGFCFAFRVTPSESVMGYLYQILVFFSIAIFCGPEGNRTPEANFTDSLMHQQSGPQNNFLTAILQELSQLPFYSLLSCSLKLSIINLCFL